MFEISAIAKQFGWIEASNCYRHGGYTRYIKNDIILDYCYRSRTAITYLFHLKYGKQTELVRRNIKVKELIRLLQNPRIHTNKGKLSMSKQTPKGTKSQIKKKNKAKNKKIKSD